MAVALDVPDGPSALRLAEAVAPHVAVLKVGLGLFYREGPGIVTALRDVVTGGLRDAVVDEQVVDEQGDGSSAGGDHVGLFLDLKLHDIPNTVAAGMRSVARLEPRYVTVHAAGGAAMVRAAVDAAPDVEIAAVTVLTSLGSAELASVGFGGTPSDVVRRLAAVAVAAGARAVVCSPREAAAVRAEVGSDVTLITPGIRAAGSRPDDQARTATPTEAVEAGSDLLVVGRPIVASSDPGAAAARFVTGC
ncbi:orotidine-5'-phosphate decarboxylase [Candidatus Protofrankia californiensis]|uniref:orotidine-5'-phosphate decarboxylase n=1 Tax=Candidatus Protofrankia californiensis TaxID=1839754 RepID=UPI0010419A02|nr:orotidine-5'-phosphate decarboxylase [Candidatus Protofrankia californiensis]